MENETNPAPETRSRADKSQPGGFRKIWILLAVLGAIAAFIFQWENAIDQSSIAETDGGAVVRVKFENEQFKFFASENVPVVDVFLCDTETGTLLGSLEPVSDAEKTFVPQLTVSREVAAQPRLIGVIITSLVCDGKPVILVLENPFRK